jgi:SAM-dependent methyltransferase
MHASASLADVFARILDADADDHDPWLHRYCGRLGSEVEAARYERQIADLLAFGGIDPRGATALDAGCGFGFALVVLRSLGVADAHGVDAYEPMIRTIRAYLPLLDESLSGHIHVRHGTVAALPYEDKTFDVALSIEAISHYRDVSAFVGEIHRVLRPGGVLLIHDGNNLRNPRVRRQTRALWDEFETGQPSVLGKTHAPDGCYRLRREELIREAFPDLSDDTVTDLVLRTAYMNRDQITAAIHAYRCGGPPPASYYDGRDAPVDPNSDAVIERLFDPYELAGQIREAGFSTHVAGYWGGASGRVLIRRANAALRRASRLTIFTATSFTISARKTAR